MSDRKTILIAEDDSAIRMLLKRALERDFTVLLAVDGSEALAMASRARVDLLITDVMMPTLDGFALAQQLRLLPDYGQVPIIFLTAADTPQAHIRGIKLGAKHFLTKPFSVASVLDKVRKVLVH